MNKKKLIGTIIGVTLLAILIAGATYAWLTFSLSVTNGNYVAGTKNFTINYIGGTAITNIPTLEAATSANAKSLYVSAYRNSTSANGIFYLKMTSETNNALTKGGVINYAVCKGTKTGGTDSAPVITPTCTGNLTAGATNVLATGTVTKTGEIELYNTGSNGIPTTKADSYYMVFFWLDPAKITNDMTADGDNSYSGYIHASAEQRDVLPTVTP
jgi:hypothetical protein